MHLRDLIRQVFVNTDDQTFNTIISAASKHDKISVEIILNILRELCG